MQVDPDIDVPLLYATTSGAPYERYEIERVDGPRWPYGRMIFSARLFADGDATVVEQQISWDRSRSGGLWLDANATNENGQPVAVSYTSSDGEVSASAPSAWDLYWPGVGSQANVWFGILWRGSDSPTTKAGESIGFVDPVAYDSWCAANGGSPLLSAPADAAALATASSQASSRSRWRRSSDRHSSGASPTYSWSRPYSALFRCRNNAGCSDLVIVPTSSRIEGPGEGSGETRSEQSVAVR